MKKLLLLTLLCSSANLFCYNGSVIDGNGHTGGKGMEPNQKAALLVLTQKPQTDTKKDKTIKIGSPKVGPKTGFGFLSH